MSNDLYHEIKFSEGSNFVVIIDTDAYAGNFEREMSAFAAGAYNFEMGHGGREMGEFEEAAEDDPRLTAIMEAVESQHHVEYDDVVCSIWPTPNRLNDGVGGHYDAEPGEAGWPAYESVAIFFERALTEEELAIVRKRAEEYASAPTGCGNGTPFKILNVRQIEVEVNNKSKVTVR